jgi:hypothetical protein
VLQCLNTANNERATTNLGSRGSESLVSGQPARSLSQRILLFVRTKHTVSGVFFFWFPSLDL